jgi:hypothetical protein
MHTLYQQCGGRGCIEWKWVWELGQGIGFRKGAGVNPAPTGGFFDNMDGMIILVNICLFNYFMKGNEYK